MTVSKSDAQRLSQDAAEMGARVLRGMLAVGPEGVKIGETNLVEWLAQYAGADLVLIASAIEHGRNEQETKICYTCGREYQGDSCPYCAEVRARLRGT